MGGFMPIITRVDKNTGTEVAINYEVIGDAEETIVFHHGNGNRIEDWHTLGFVEALKSGYQLVLIDSRGYGKSSKLHDPKEYSLKSRADDTIAVLDEEGIEQAHCLGASVGAATCFLLARFYPERFKSFIFATPYFTLFGEEIKREMAKGIEAYVDKLEELIGGPIENTAIRDTFLSNDALALLAANSSEWFNYQDYIKYVTTPTLVYAGSREPSIEELTVLSESLEATSGQTCHFHVFSDMDHAAVYWSGESVAPVISEFVDKVASCKCQFRAKL